MLVTHAPMTFGAVLRQLRIAAALSQAALAERAGLSARGISDLERGARRSPHLATVGLLADALALSPTDRQVLLAAARPVALPKVRTAPFAHAAPLPVPPTALIGREQELADLTALLRQPTTRLITVTGPGGSGKTRLALEIGTRLLDDFSDGVAFVDLAPVRAAPNVVPMIASVLRVRETSGEPIWDTLARSLVDRHMLLLLDNVEHLLEAAGDVATLLTRCPHLVVLATSREPLRVRAEQVFPAPPLPLPDPQRAMELADLARVPSVDLFVERAQAAQPGFMLTRENAAAIAAICRRLDGLPLAIELAAARVRLLPPEALLTRLERSLPFLTTGARDAPLRQRTLRDTIGWSYDLLPPPDQVLLRRLSVFIGGWTMEAAQAVASPDGSIDVLEGLGRLLERNLVRRDEEDAGEPRFGLLETIREFGLEQLAESGEETRVRQRHAQYVATFAEAVEAHVYGPGELAWLDRSEQESGNITAALEWCAAHDPDTGLRIAGALWYYWHTRGGLSRGRREVEQIVARGEGAAPLPTAKAKLTLGQIALFQPDYPRARIMLQESLELFSQLNDIQHIDRTRFWQANMEWHASGSGESVAMLQASLLACREHGDRFYEGLSLFFLGMAAAHLRPDSVEGESFHRAALAVFREIGYPSGIAMTLGYLGEVLLAQGRLSDAAATIQDSLARRYALRDRFSIPQQLEGLGRVAAAQGDVARAVRLWSAADRLRRDIGTETSQVFRDDHARFMQSLVQQLEPAQFAAAWAAGQELTMEQVAEEVLP